MPNLLLPSFIRSTAAGQWAIFMSAQRLQPTLHETQGVLWTGNTKQIGFNIIKENQTLGIFTILFGFPWLDVWPPWQQMTRWSESFCSKPAGGSTSWTIYDIFFKSLILPYIISNKTRHSETLGFQGYPPAHPQNRSKFHFWRILFKFALSRHVSWCKYGRNSLRNVECNTFTSKCLRTPAATKTMAAAWEQNHSISPVINQRIQ